MNETTHKKQKAHNLARAKAVAELSLLFPDEYSDIRRQIEKEFPSDIPATDNKERHAYLAFTSRKARAILVEMFHDDYQELLDKHKEIQYEKAGVLMGWEGQRGARDIKAQRVKRAKAKRKSKTTVKGLRVDTSRQRKIDLNAMSDEEYIRFLRGF